MTRADFETKLVEIFRSNGISYKADCSCEYCNDYAVKIGIGLRLKISVGNIAVSVSTFSDYPNAHVSFMDLFYDEISHLSVGGKKNSLFFHMKGMATFMTVALTTRESED